jgi:hypothetical protein
MRFVLALIALVSTSAFACPDLAGKYTVCRSSTGSSGGSRDVVVTQSVRNRITTFFMTATDEETQERDTTSVIADGKVRTESVTDPETGLVIVSATQASCSGNALILNNKTTIDNNELAIVKVTITKSGNQIRQIIAGQALGNEFNDTVICE